MSDDGTKKVEALSDAKKRLEKARYNRLVLKAFNDMEHADKRAFLDKKAVIEAANREKL